MIRTKHLKSATHRGWEWDLVRYKGEYKVDALDIDGQPIEEEPVDFPEGCTDAEAIRIFDKWVEEELRRGEPEEEPAPNWEAQAAYDELHGTINGEDAGIVQMRELWGE